VSRHKKSVSLGANLRGATQFLSERTGQTETVLCALIVRMVVVCLSFQSIAQVSHDHAAFGAEMGWVARSIASGHGFSSPFFPSTGPTALMPPLFPYLLACVFRVCGVYTATAAFVILSLDSFLSALTCIPIRMSLLEVVGQRRAQLASWLWVIYPFAIYFSAVHVWDYALTSFLFATSFWFAQRIHLHDRSLAWCRFGLLCGLTVLSNPSVFSTFPFLFLLALLKVRGADGRWLRCGVVFLLSMILVVAPWIVRNCLVMHAASPVRDGFWLELWAGNAGDTSTSNPSWAHPASNPAEMRLFGKEGEAAYIAHKRSMALAHVGHHSVSFVVVSCRRAIRFWTGFWSVRSEYLYWEPLDIPNVFFCTSITFLMLRGIFRWWKEDRKELLPYLFLLIVFPIPYYLTHSSMDYRQPIEPQIIVLVTIGIFGFKDRIASADSPEVTTSRQYHAEPVMAYTSSRKSL
jgi:4-amino-4-deoxy-L-arabinose transferase-like glycosyltransferase